MVLIMRWVVGFLVLFCCNLFASSNNPHVVFVNPGYQADNPTGNFWSNVSLFTEAAAADLDIKLTILYAQRDHIYMRELVKQGLKLKPDYLILVNEKSVGPSLMKLVARSNVNVFFLLNDLTKAQFNDLNPSEKQRVVGGVRPNNYQAGYKLALQLIASNSASSNSSYKMLALLGDHATQAALDRKQGLLDAIRDSEKSIELVDALVANWSMQNAYSIVNGFLKRNIELDVIWAANDAIAFGAQQAAIEHKKTLVIGGVNWDKSPTMLPLFISIGGHVTLGALAMVFIHDHSQSLVTRPEHRTVDIFVDDRTKSSQQFIQLMAMKKINLIDFTRFSKMHDKPLLFSIRNLVEAVEK